MRKTAMFFFTTLLLVLILGGCSKYDDSDLKTKTEDLENRIATIEQWSKTINTNISSLQGLITALESNDMITDVTEAADKSGYIISFSNSPAITIKHGTIGKDGVNGTNGTPGADGTAPIIGTAKFDDGLFYWTVQKDALSADWLLDEQGNKIRTTGNNGKPGVDGKTAIAPQVKIDPLTNEWWISTDSGAHWTTTGVNATVNSIFAKVDTANPDNVTITLADATTITLPRSATLTIGFESYEPIKITKSKTSIKVLLPKTFKETDYTFISAEIQSSLGSSIDFVTRAAVEPLKVTITKPTFTNKVYDNNVTVELVAPSGDYVSADPSVLTLTLVDNKGQKITTSLSFTVFIGDEINVSAKGGLEGVLQVAGLILTDIKVMSITGTLNVDDFQFIEDNIINLNALDLSETDITAIPEDAFGSRYGRENKTLKTLIFPKKLTSIEGFAFVLCKGLSGTLTIPNGVTSIGEAAFGFCLNLTGTLTLPSSITSIGEDAFSLCSGLTGTLTIPRGVKSIGVGAFSECTGLTGILMIPSGVESIGERAFDQCSKIEAIKMENHKPISYAHEMFPENIPIYVPTLSLSEYRKDLNGWSQRRLIGYDTVQ